MIKFKFETRSAPLGEVNTRYHVRTYVRKCASVAPYVPAVEPVHACSGTYRGAAQVAGHAHARALLRLVRDVHACALLLAYGPGPAGLPRRGHRPPERATIYGHDGDA